MIAAAETVEQARRRKQAALHRRTRQSDCADKFRAIAEWWRLEAEGSAAPETPLQFAANADLIAADMEARPGHYCRKPIDHTCWQWSRL